MPQSLAQLYVRLVFSTKDRLTSQVAEVVNYIRRQPEHHAKRGFQEEFRLLLNRYALAFDEAYV